MSQRYLQVNTIICDNCGRETHKVLTGSDLGVGRPDYIWDEIFEQELQSQGWAFIEYNQTDKETGLNYKKVACSNECKEALLNKLKQESHVVLSKN